jgi:hypothetical protein
VERPSSVGVSEVKAVGARASDPGGCRANPRASF